MSDLARQIESLSPAKRALIELRLRRAVKEPGGQLIPRRSDNGPAPLSFAQQRLWFLDQLEPGGSTYNVNDVLILEGPLNVERLHGAIRAIVARHESLRTAFFARNGSAVQVIDPSVVVSLPVVDLQSLPAAQREAEARSRAVQEANRPFNLEQAPLLRFLLLRLGEQEHWLVLTMHHIVSDQWSQGVFQRELSLFYNAACHGGPVSLRGLPIQYADFAVWQRQWLQGKVLEDQVSYWKRQLGQTPPVLQLPTDRARPAQQTFAGAFESFVVPKDVTDSLKALSRREEATVFMTVLAAFQTLLHRYSGQDDILVGSPSAGRNRTETEDLIGFFVNTLVLRGDLSGNPTFRELLGRIRQVALEAYAHQDLPFEKLVEELRPERDLSRSPLFQVMLAIQNAPIQPIELAHVAIRPIRVQTGTAKYDLTLFLEETDSGMAGELEYNTDLFNPSTIARMAGHLNALLKSIAAEPDQRLSRLAILSEAERHRLLVEWNDTEAEYPRDAGVHHLFEAQAKRAPDAVAVVFEDRPMTYAELNQQADRVANHLRTLGVGPEVRVGICIERSFEMLVGILAILKAGGAYVPIDSSYPSERLEFLLQDAGLRLVLCDKKSRNAVSTHGVQIVDIKGALASERKPDGGALPRPDWQSSSLAYVLYTSGSTGKPKGVQISHGALVNVLTAMGRELQLSDEDTLLAVTTLSFDIAGLELFLPLITGLRVVVASREVAMDGARLSRLLSKSGATVMQATPATWQLLLRAGWEGNPRLKILCGGEALSNDLAQQLLARGEALWNLYGPTETTIWSATARMRPGETVGIGRPIANTEFYVLDPFQEPVPVGVPGELFIGGVGLARGYLNRPEAMAERFVAHPFSQEPGARLFRTGDLVRYRDDATLEYLGRIDRQNKIHGYRIGLGEIESVLKQHALVLETAAMVREDSPDEKRLVVYVVLRPGRSITVSELRSFLSGKLPDYMVPTVFAVVDSLPITSNGKVDWRALPSPEKIRPDLEKSYVAPRDILEQQLTRFWEKILSVKPIGMRDNFFDLGGHSLMAVRLFAQVEKLTGKRLPLVTLFQAPTIEELAGLLRKQGWQPPWSSLVAIKPDGSRPPFYCVHGVGGNILEFEHLARYIDVDQPLYGIQARGLDGHQAPHASVQEMATHYINEIREFQPQGPYYLGGSSFGGLVAYEMAQQLRAQNQEVGLLVFFDTYAPGYPKFLPTTTAFRRKFYWWRDRIELHWQNLLVAQGRHKVDYFVVKAGRLGKRIVWKLKRIHKVLHKRIEHTGLPSAIRAVQHAGDQAHLDYIAKPYPGKVTLYRASNQPQGIYEDRTNGWLGLALGGVEVIDIPGHHGAIMREPRTGVLVGKLTETLHKVQENNAATRP